MAELNANRFTLRLSLSILLAGCVGTAITLPGFAQIAPQSNPGLLTPSAPEQLPGTPRKESIKVLPTVDLQTDDTIDAQAPDTPPIVDLQNPDFTVKQITIEGNTVVSDAELKPLTEPYTNRVVTLTELGKLVDAINKLYYQKGYFTSQAYIPPQDVDQQSITIKVMEGKVGNISVTGNRFLKAKVVLRDVDYHENDILNVEELQNRLRRISSQPTIYKIKGVLTPGAQTGQTDVELQVRERFPWQISPTFDNQGRPFIGTYRWGTEVENRNVTGLGDQLRALDWRCWHANCHRLLFCAH